MKTHVLGFPRIGAFRELKKAVESYWQGRISLDELTQTGRQLRLKHWQIQKEAGLSFVATGDFSFYDHVLDTTVMLGYVPPRFLTTNTDVSAQKPYFHMARGDQVNNIHAMEMTKWFDTNYHYIVPEITPELQIRKQSNKIVEETREAIEAGFSPKPVLLGPITYLSLARDSRDNSRWNRIDEIVTVYCEVIIELANLCDAIQIDEPILCTDMLPEARDAFASVYQKLNQAAGSSQLLLATYFGALEDNLDVAVASGCAGLHIDLVRRKDQLESVLAALPETMFLSLGIIDGRNIWKTNLASAAELCAFAKSKLGNERVWLGSSCSLLHSPVDLDNETQLDAELKSWMAFAVQKCREVAMLGTENDSPEKAEILRQNALAIQSRKSSSRVTDADIQARCNAVTPEMYRRQSLYKQRKEAQSWLKLPSLPTTTIGSFPQTTEIRNQRQKYRKGEISNEEYETFLKNEIKSNVEKQEAVGACHAQLSRYPQSVTQTGRSSLVELDLFRSGEAVAVY